MYRYIHVCVYKYTYIHTYMHTYILHKHACIRYDIYILHTYTYNIGQCYRITSPTDCE